MKEVKIYTLIYSIAADNSIRMKEGTLKELENYGKDLPNIGLYKIAILDARCIKIYGQAE